MLRCYFLSSFIEFRSAVSEKKSKMSQPIRGQGGHLLFPIGPKNTNMVEEIEILLPVKFPWIPFSSFREEVENVSANQRPGWPFCFSDQPEKPKFGRGHWYLASCQVSLNSVQQFQRRSLKMSQPIRGQGGHLVFLINPKNTNLEEDVEMLLPVKFCWFPFSGFRETVENVSANQRPGRPSCFSDQPEKHKLGRGCWDVASCQFSLNSVQQVSEKKSKMSQPIRGQSGYFVFLISQKNTNLVEDVEMLFSCQVSFNSVQRFQRRSRKWLSQSEGWAAILFFQQPEKHKLGRGCWDVAFCQVWLNSFQRFQRKSRKCLSQSETRAAILFFRSARKTQTW